MQSAICFVLKAQVDAWQLIYLLSKSQKEKKKLIFKKKQNEKKKNKNVSLMNCVYLFSCNFVRLLLCLDFDTPFMRGTSHNTYHIMD